jgi:hypothetical protein
VGHVTFGEIRVIGYINALHNSLPPVLIFHIITLTNHMVIGALAGTHGTLDSSSYSKGDKFLEFLDHFICHVKLTKDCWLLLL